MLLKTRSQIATDTWKNPKIRARRVAALKRACNVPRIRKLQRRNALARWSDPEFKKATLAAVAKTQGSSEFKKKFAKIIRKTWTPARLAAHRKHAKSREFRKKKSLASKRAWRTRSREKAAVVYRNVLSGLRTTQPNVAEKVLLATLNTLWPKQFKLNFGEGRIRIGRKIPDILHISKPLVVELFGDHCHEDYQVGNRRVYFGKRGYDCVVIWASQLRKGPEFLKRKLEGLL